MGMPTRTLSSLEIAFTSFSFAMGSLDAAHYIRCHKCSGLFQDTETAASHSDACSGDIVSSPCDLVACSKDEYIKYVQPQLSRPVRRGRPPRQKPKMAVRVNPTVKPSVKPGPIQNSAEKESGQPRRYGLRKGASEAFHLKISNMQRLLGVRSKQSPLPTTKTNTTHAQQKHPPSQVPRHADVVKCSKGVADVTESTSDTVDDIAIDDTQDNNESQNKTVVVEGTILPEAVIKVEYVETEPDIAATDVVTVITPPGEVRSEGGVIVITPPGEVRAEGGVTVVTPPGEVQAEGAIPDTPTDNEQPTSSHPEASSQLDIMHIQQHLQSSNSVLLGDVDPIEEGAQGDVEMEDPNYQPDTEVRASPRLMKKKGKVTKSLSQGPDATGMYRCNICPYVSKKEGMFRRHMGAHNDGQMYTCEYCGAEFVYRRLYKQHLGTHQGFKCDTCSKTFSRRHDLSRHVESAHTGTKKYVCTECDYECRHHHMFADHLRKHSKERYTCSHEDCEFRTIYRRALMHHLNTVHNSEKHIVCEHCTYKTNDPFAFSKHKKIHTADKMYGCSLCDYKAHSLSYVTAHMTTHNAEKIYHCDTCEYSSARRTGIRSHMMKHIGVKPWQCPACEYSATTRTKVQRHIGMRHKGQGQPTRRNIIIKFDLDAYRAHKTEEAPAQGAEEGEEAGSPQFRRVVERYSGTNTALLGHKYMVIEMVEDADGAALASNLVGQEVVVRQEADTELPTEPQAERGEVGENSQCLYKCALCELTDTCLEVVQEHMATQHSDLIAAEIVDAATASAEYREEMEVPETISITVETDSTMEVVEEEGEQGDEVTCIIADGTVIQQTEVQTLSPLPPAIQTVTMQDDAVSTAVESILHLQHVPI